MSATAARGLESATISMSTRPSSSACRATSASALRVGKPGCTSAWVRIAVIPLASMFSACVRARSMIESNVSVAAYSTQDAIAPFRSPIGGWIRSKLSALSRCACGSAGAVSSSQPSRSSVAAGVDDGQRAGGGDICHEAVGQAHVDELAAGQARVAQQVEAEGQIGPPAGVRMAGKSSCGANLGAASEPVVWPLGEVGPTINAPTGRRFGFKLAERVFRPLGCCRCEHHWNSTATLSRLRQHGCAHPGIGPRRGAGRRRPTAGRTGSRPPARGQSHVAARGADGAAHRRADRRPARQRHVPARLAGRDDPADRGGAGAQQPGAAIARRGPQHARVAGRRARRVAA